MYEKGDRCVAVSCSIGVGVEGGVGVCNGRECCGGMWVMQQCVGVIVVWGVLVWTGDTGEGVW